MNAGGTTLFDEPPIKETLQDIREKTENDTSIFLKNLQWFLCLNIPYFYTLESLHKHTDHLGDWLYVTFNNGVQKRININYDSHHEIMLDLLTHIESEPYLRPSETIDFTGDK